MCLSSLSPARPRVGAVASSCAVFFALSVAGAPSRAAAAPDWTAALDHPALASYVGQSGARVALLSPDHDRRAQGALDALAHALSRQAKASAVIPVAAIDADPDDVPSLLVRCASARAEVVVLAWYFASEGGADDALLAMVYDGAGHFRAAFFLRAAGELDEHQRSGSPRDEEMEALEILYDHHRIEVRATQHQGRRSHWTDYQPIRGRDLRLSPLEYFSLVGAHEQLRRHRIALAVQWIVQGLILGTAAAGIALMVLGERDQVTEQPSPCSGVDVPRGCGVPWTHLNEALFFPGATAVWASGYSTLLNLLAFRRDPFRDKSTADALGDYDVRLRGKLGLPLPSPPPSPESRFQFTPTGGPSSLGAGLALSF